MKPNEMWELWEIIIKLYCNEPLYLEKYPNYKIEKSGNTYIITSK